MRRPGARGAASEERDPRRPFGAPTRRAFVAMLGAAAAAIALRERVPATVICDPATGRPVWIGH